jgi:hypothetical protein
MIRLNSHLGGVWEISGVNYGVDVWQRYSQSEVLCWSRASRLGGQWRQCAARALRALSRRGVLSGESSIPTLESVPVMASSADVVSLLGGIIVEFLFRWWFGLSRWKPKLRSARAGDDSVSVASLLWAFPWRVYFGSCLWLVRRWGQWTPGQQPRMVDVHWGGGLEIHGGQMLHEAWCFARLRLQE